MCLYTHTQTHANFQPNALLEDSALVSIQLMQIVHVLDSPASALILLWMLCGIRRTVLTVSKWFAGGQWTEKDKTNVSAVPLIGK